jgi:hypothetical protein
MRWEAGHWQKGVPQSQTTAAALVTKSIDHFSQRGVGYRIVWVSGKTGHAFWII